MNSVVFKLNSYSRVVFFALCYANLLLNNKIEKNNVYNNVSDKFELEQTEDIILEKLTGSISDSLISSIFNLNDN